MIIQVLHCPYCHEIDIVKHGLSPEGKQRYRCRTCLEGVDGPFSSTIPTPANHLR